MADVSGTDVHYTSDSKLGLTTLTFRKRRYMFPSVVVAGSEPHGGSTSSLQSTGACLMLDVGLFCPHCSGAISAQLSESHSKLVISKEDGGPIASLHGRDVHCLQLPAEQSTASSGYTTTIETVQASPESPHRSKHAKVKKIQTEQETRDVKVPRLKLSIQPESSQNTSNLHQSINVDTVDKLSSSDYESLDQDSRFGSLSSTVNSAEVVHSPNTTGVSSPRRDDAYSSMVSSGQGCGTSQGEPDFPPTMHSSLPRNIHFSSSIHDSRARLNNVYTNMMSQSDHSAVDDVFRKDLLNGHGNDIQASGASSFHSEHISQANGEMPKAFNEKSRREDDLSNRSTSPETFVDDILENVGGEVYSVDATLPRVFSLKTEHGRKSLSAKRKNKRHRAKQSSNTAGNVDHNISAADFKDAIRSDMKSSFSHEEFFEEIFEALTELEEGQTPDWNSVFNVDRKETASTPDSGHVVDEQELEMYKNGLGYFEKRIPNPPTSSCECLADDRSRDLDSSFEHFPSMAETPSETSAGDYSLEGYMSSSEGSEDHSDLKPSTLLMDQLIEDTRILTESLNVLSSEEIENVSVKDQYDVTDEVFLDNEQNAFPPDESAKVPYSGMTIGGSRIPRIIQPEERYENVHDDMSNDSDDSSIQESSSLENLLSCNALHCSTSDLDEPYATELKHNGIVEEESECVADDSRYQTASIEEDFQKCLQTKTHETDEFVPEKDQDKKAEPQVLKEAYEAAQYVASLVGSHQVTEPKLCSAHAQGTIDQAATEASVKTDSNSSFDTVLKSGDWKDFSSEADTKVASFETKENMSKEQAQQFLKYVLSQSSHTQHTQEHTSDLDACLDEVCQTCEMKPEKEEENIIVKNEEVTTQEVTFVFAWPKKLAKGRNLVPTPDKSGQPFRTLHLRRVMRVSDFDMEVVEGPTIETVEYTKEGTAKRSIQAYEGPVTTKQLTAAHHDITEEPTCDSDADLKHQAKGSISVSAVSHGVNTAVLVNQEDTTPTNKCDSHDHTSELEDTILTTQNEVHHATDEIVSNTQDGYCAPETDSGRTTIKRDQASSVRSAMDGPASPTFIEQRERNVKLLKLDKYFSPSSSSEEVSRSESGDLINGPVSPEQKDSSQIFLLQTGNQPETAYETCSEIPLCAMDIADKRSLRRYGLFGHPVPCERCIQLERELREKLDELSTMVEFLGRRTSLAGSKSASDSDRVELDSQPEGSTFSVIPNMGFSNGLDFDSGTEVVATENDAGDEIGDYLDPMREIEHYAENMSKYILFRAKLHIVLKNATIVPPFVPTTVPSDLGPDAFRVLDPATSSGTVQHFNHRHLAQHHMHAALADTCFHNPSVFLKNADVYALFLDVTLHGDSSQDTLNFMTAEQDELEKDLHSIKDKLIKLLEYLHESGPYHSDKPNMDDPKHVCYDNDNSSEHISQVNKNIKATLPEYACHNCYDISDSDSSISLVISSDSESQTEVVHNSQEERQSRDVMILLSSDSDNVPQLSIPLSGRVKSLDIVVNMSDSEQGSSTAHQGRASHQPSTVITGKYHTGVESDTRIAGQEIGVVPFRSQSNLDHMRGVGEITQEGETTADDLTTLSDVDMAIHKNLDELLHLDNEVHEMSTVPECTAPPSQTCFSPTPSDQEVSESSEDEIDALFDDLISSCRMRLPRGQIASRTNSINSEQKVTTGDIHSIPGKGCQTFQNTDSVVDQTENSHQYPAVSETFSKTVSLDDFEDDDMSSISSSELSEVSFLTVVRSPNRNKSIKNGIPSKSQTGSPTNDGEGRIDSAAPSMNSHVMIGQNHTPTSLNNNSCVSSYKREAQNTPQEFIKQHEEDEHAYERTNILQHSQPSVRVWRKKGDSLRRHGPCDVSGVAAKRRHQYPLRRISGSSSGPEHRERHISVNPERGKYSLEDLRTIAKRSNSHYPDLSATSIEQLSLTSENDEKTRTSEPADAHKVPVASSGMVRVGPVPFNRYKTGKIIMTRNPHPTCLISRDVSLRQEPHKRPKHERKVSFNLNHDSGESPSEAWNTSPEKTDHLFKNTDHFSRKTDHLTL